MNLENLQSILATRVRIMAELTAVLDRHEVTDAQAVLALQSLAAKLARDAGIPHDVYMTVAAGTYDRAQRHQPTEPGAA